ncbi:uncharacterized protein KIAA0513-like [Rhopilema esculentum]|uniref:uncharacterized protein KIAA0513-like n=1 Tax=Rhopilema esculentum TaxID=499914 RepID=UPI0031DBB6EA
MLKAEMKNIQSLGKQTDQLKNFCIDYNGETNHFEKECEKFMRRFVADVFSESVTITQEAKSKFGLLCQHNEGRCWFARLMDAQRVEIKEVEEVILFRLVQYYAIVLFECYIADDFAPAASLLNMSFTYYHVSSFSELPHDSPKKSDTPSKLYVFEYLKDQAIWKTMRFWTSAFLFAVDSERQKRPKFGSWRSLNEEQQRELNQNEEYSAFAHLGTFLYIMKSLNVAKEMKEVFISKISTIENLSQEQLHELIERVEKAE